MDAGSDVPRNLCGASPDIDWGSDSIIHWQELIVEMHHSRVDFANPCDNVADVCWALVPKVSEIPRSC